MGRNSLFLILFAILLIWIGVLGKPGLLLASVVKPDAVEVS